MSHRRCRLHLLLQPTSLHHFRSLGDCYNTVPGVVVLLKDTIAAGNGRIKNTTNGKKKENKVETITIEATSKSWADVEQETCHKSSWKLFGPSPPRRQRQRQRRYCNNYDLACAGNNGTDSITASLSLKTRGSQKVCSKHGRSLSTAFAPVRHFSSASSFSNRTRYHAKKEGEEEQKLNKSHENYCSRHRRRQRQIVFLTDVEGDAAYFDRYVRNSHILSFRPVQPRLNNDNDNNNNSDYFPYDKEVIFLHDDDDHDDTNALHNSDRHHHQESADKEEDCHHDSCSDCNDNDPTSSSSSSASSST